MLKGQPSILIVENDPIDILIFKRVLADMGYRLPVEFISDGERALRMLENPDQLTPWLILLDLNIPKINGIEFLSRVKKNDRLKWIPVVIVSSSENPDDIISCVNQGACGYLLKEFEYAAFRESVIAAIRYWARSRTPARIDCVNIEGNVENG